MRWATSGSGAAAIGIALMMALSPAATAASAHTTLSAPYTGTTSTNWNGAGSACGGTALVKHNAHWTASTGLLTSSDVATATVNSCPGVGGSGPTFTSSEAYGEVELGIPFHGVTGNHKNLTVNYAWKETTKGSGISGTLACSYVPVNTAFSYEDQYCYAEAGWYVFTEAYIFDTTNDTVVSQDYNYWEVQNYSDFELYSDWSAGTYTNGSYTFGCSPYSFQSPLDDISDWCLGTGTQTGVNQTWLSNSYGVSPSFYNDTMLASHHYQVLIYFDVDDYFYVDASGYDSSGTVVQPLPSGVTGGGYSTNVATHGNKLSLSSIVL
jgi:hypothetical protein